MTPRTLLGHMRRLCWPLSAWPSRPVYPGTDGVEMPVRPLVAADPAPDTAATYTFRVGWTDSRPVVPDEHTAHVVIVGADSGVGLTEARQLAAQLVGTSALDCQMVTSVVLVEAEL